MTPFRMVPSISIPQLLPRQGMLSNGPWQGTRVRHVSSERGERRFAIKRAVRDTIPARSIITYRFAGEGAAAP